MIYEAIKKGLPLLKEHEWETDKLHISDLGIDEGCPRQLWLRLHGAESRPLNIGEMLMFDAGQRIHDRMAEVLKLGGLDVIDTEQKIELDGITGRYDLKLRMENKVVIVDFKTARGKAFDYLIEPKASHVAQVQGYLTAENAYEGMIIYVDREGQNGIRVFNVCRNDEETYKNVKRVKEIAKGDIPPILKPIVEIVERKNFSTVYVKQPWQCDYCKYQDISCPGALPPEIRERQIAGRIKDDEFTPTDEKFEFVKGLIE